MKPKTRSTGRGALELREQKLAYRLLMPTFIIVFAIVLFPLLSNFWIAFKPVELSDLRAASVKVTERFKPRPQTAGEEVELVYQLRNISSKGTVRSVSLTHSLPQGVSIKRIPQPCVLSGTELSCDLEDFAPREKRELVATVVLDQAAIDQKTRAKDVKAVVSGVSDNILTSFEFALDNFKKIFAGPEFWPILWVSIAYTIGGTGGALILGLFAALLLNRPFPGRNVLRGVFLFPYVAPVIAVAFAWVLLLDPGPGGTLNALLVEMGAIDGPINFLGQRWASFSAFGAEVRWPLALTTVIAFEAWRYFPLSFLFILARMQSMPSDIYEAAEIDGATPFQQFWALSLPQLAGILSVLFLLRFIWTFNKFDDIFLLTGGAAGTRTLTVDVYEQAFAVSNLGAGAAVAVVLFAVLLGFAICFFWLSPKDEM